tara:strand:- start:74 stop:271 length:198 start_codon:yes stop_codon:yes gene_type:complete
MDTKTSAENYSDSDHENWEDNYRRDYIEGDLESLLQVMCESFGSKKEARNVIARRERMATVMYDL